MSLWALLGRLSPFLLHAFQPGSKGAAGAFRAKGWLAPHSSMGTEELLSAFPFLNFPLQVFDSCVLVAWMF